MIEAMRQRFCRHEWGPWTDVMLMSMQEIMSDVAGSGSDKSIATARKESEGQGVEARSGSGEAAEPSESFEHRACARCGRFDVRPKTSAR